MPRKVVLLSDISALYTTKNQETLPRLYFCHFDQRDDKLLLRLLHSVHPVL
jgi:hypothetical protein